HLFCSLYRCRLRVAVRRAATEFLWPGTKTLATIQTSLLKGRRLEQFFHNFRVPGGPIPPLIQNSVNNVQNATSGRTNAPHPPRSIQSIDTTFWHALLRVLELEASCSTRTSMSAPLFPPILALCLGIALSKWLICSTVPLLLVAFFLVVASWVLLVTKETP